MLGETVMTHSVSYKLDLNPLRASDALTRHGDTQKLTVTNFFITSEILRIVQDKLLSYKRAYNFLSNDGLVFK